MTQGIVERLRRESYTTPFLELLDDRKEAAAIIEELTETLATFVSGQVLTNAHFMRAKSVLTKVRNS